MMNLLVIAWIVWMAVSMTTKVFRKIRAERTFNAKRNDIYFRSEPFLWMRRVV